MKRPDRPTREMRSQGKTLQKYLDMLKHGDKWSQRNILGIRSFLRRDMLDADRLGLLNEFLAAAGKGEVETDALHHAGAVAYIRKKSCNGLGEMMERCRFSAKELACVGASTRHLLVGLVPNARHPERWLPVYRAVGPLGALTYIGTKYDRIKVLDFDEAKVVPAARATRSTTSRATRDADAEAKRLAADAEVAAAAALASTLSKVQAKAGKRRRA